MGQKWDEYLKTYASKKKADLTDERNAALIEMKEEALAYGVEYALALQEQRTNAGVKKASAK